MKEDKQKSEKQDEVQRLKVQLADALKLANLKSEESI
jgi:hypothetical protein